MGSRSNEIAVALLVRVAEDRVDVLPSRPWSAGCSSRCVRFHARPSYASNAVPRRRSVSASAAGRAGRHLEAQRDGRVVAQHADVAEVDVLGEADHAPGVGWLSRRSERPTRGKRTKSAVVKRRMGTESRHVAPRKPRPTTRRLRRMRGTSTGSPCGRARPGGSCPRPRGAGG
jgi:hypothetical protein